MKAHRRVLLASEPRCHPSPDCPQKDKCARFKSPMPQGVGGRMGNFRGAAGSLYCSSFLSEMVEDEAPLTLKKDPLPPFGH